MKNNFLENVWKSQETSEMNVVLFGWFAMSVVSLGSLLYNLPVDRRKSVRDLEKLSTKISKLQCSLLFNNTCLREGILPTYSNLLVRKPLAKVSHWNTIPGLNPLALTRKPDWVKLHPRTKYKFLPKNIPCVDLKLNYFTEGLPSVERCPGMSIPELRVLSITLHWTIHVWSWSIIVLHGLVRVSLTYVHARITCVQARMYHDASQCVQNGCTQAATKLQLSCNQAATKLQPSCNQAARKVQRCKFDAS